MHRRTFATLMSVAAGLCWRRLHSRRTPSRSPTSSSCPGAGATVGNNWKNGSSLAVDEINAAGGILGKKIKLEFVDTGDPTPARRAPPSSARSTTSRSRSSARSIPARSAPRCSSPTRPRCRRSSAARRPTSPRRAPSISSAPRSARTCRCRRSPTTCATRSRPRSWPIVYVNNDFGKGGRDAIIKELETPRHQGGRRHLDRSRPGRLRRRRHQAQGRQRRRHLRLPQRGGERALPARGQEAGPRQAADRRDHAARPEGHRSRRDAANGVKGHVGLTVDAPIPAIQAFGKKFEAKFDYKPDHNGVKGYIAPYMIKAAAEKAGKLDAKAIAAALHGLTITPDKVPGILIEATWDDTGEIDRISLPRRGQGRQAGHHADAAEAEEVTLRLASARSRAGMRRGAGRRARICCPATRATPLRPPRHSVRCAGP